MNMLFPAIQADEKNVTYAFRLTISLPPDSRIRLAASIACMLFQDGDLLFRGPMRTAHGHSLLSEIPLASRKDSTLVVEVAYYGINGFYCVEEPPFFICTILVGDKPIANTEDFQVFRLDDRVRKVPRYSFQRPFSESYRMETDRRALYVGENVPYPQDTAVEVRGNTLHTSDLSLPILNLTELTNAVEQGTLCKNQHPYHFRDRCITQIGDKLKGYRLDELEEFPVEELAEIGFHPYAEVQKKDVYENEYLLLDAGMNYTSFIGAELCAETDAIVFFTFDEILWHEALDDIHLRTFFDSKALPLSFSRLECCNVIKYSLKKGEYRLCSFEPYTFRYLKIAVKGRIRLKRVYHIPYENPSIPKDIFCTDRPELNQIFEAGVRTFAQNAVDVLTDCPSRERAGWLCDSFFTAQAEALLTGGNRVERNLLESYRLVPPLPELPASMPPMCYPADHNDGQYIPNWAMFLIIELEDYQRRTGDEELINAFGEKIRSLLDWLESYENEYGLLENLPGWVFVEWSKCADFVQDVNFPTNMLYYRALFCASRLYGEEVYRQRADNLRAVIRRLSFNGRFFEDNLLRKNGRLVATGNITETCQYYAFRFGIATKDEDPVLYQTMVEQFGPLRSSYVHTDIFPSNAFIGNFLRYDWLSRSDERKILLAECQAYFLRMADRTMTLWENNEATASCAHGFASYLTVLLARAVFGYWGFDPVSKTVYLTESDSSICGTARFPIAGQTLEIILERGVRSIILPDGYQTGRPTLP